MLKDLLSNAFKFTAQGHVSFSISIVTHGWTQDHLLLGRAPSVLAFRVSDTGIGISPEKQRIIFEAFQQADAGTSRKYGGTGLGLAGMGLTIVKKAVERMAGTLGVESELGQGSRFWIELPARPL